MDYFNRSQYVRGTGLSSIVSDRSSICQRFLNMKEGHAVDRGAGECWNICLKITVRKQTLLVVILSQEFVLLTIFC